MKEVMVDTEFYINKMPWLVLHANKTNVGFNELCSLNW